MTLGTKRKSETRLGTAVLVIACACGIAGFLVSCDGGTSIHGIVQDSGNRPIADANVSLTVGSRSREAQSSGDGAFKIGMTHSPWNPELSLSVSKVGYRSFEKRFHAHDQLRNIIITLEADPEAKEVASKPQRSVKGLPRYMTDIPQPIPEQIKLPDAPKTARNVQCFGAFKESSTMIDVVRKCGIPDEHQGSGIFIFLYDMDDGSFVAIGTADLKKLLYINHIENTRASSLLQTPQSAQGPAR
jgi:Carboxypeptidase regulatory-like domain